MMQTSNSRMVRGGFFRVTPAIPTGCFLPTGGRLIRRLVLLTLTLGQFAAPLVVGAAEAPEPWKVPALADLSLEELMNIEVTSVARREQTMASAPAAIFAITQDDLRRSGVTSLPEALRMVPGLAVGRVDAYSWAISSRGFNDPFANKLLVLIDGRSVYTPLFSGVYWDVQDTPLEDIERIEVVRGPGATLWGANAVNGVINIITKSAKQTQGGLVSVGAGTEEQGFGVVRYGGKFSDDAYFRVYAKYFNRDSSVLPDGNPANDRWNMARGGFRSDWEPSTQNQLTLQGDVYSGTLDFTGNAALLAFPYSQQVADHIRVDGGNLLGRWSHSYSDRSDLKLQFYYDRTRRESFYLREERNTFDADLQHRFPLGSRHDVIWGAGYRISSDRIRDSFPITWLPASRTAQLFSAFVQDEVALVPDRLKLTFGSKFEHNDYTGFEIQPNARIFYTPHHRHAVWASVSRSVRTPSRADHNVRLNDRVFPTGTPSDPVEILSIFGDSAFRSEELLAYELGYRVQPHDRVSLDLAAFYNQYDRLRTAEFVGVDIGDPNYANVADVIHLKLGNLARGETYGGELAANLQLAEWWRWRAAYTYLQVQIHTKSGSNDVDAERDEGTSPHHQISLRSSLDLPQNLQLDCMARYVELLPLFGAHSYVSMDVRLGWNPKPNLEFSVVGQNLLDDRNGEFAPTVVSTQRTEVPRSFYGKVTWRF